MSPKGNRILAGKDRDQMEMQSAAGMRVLIVIRNETALVRAVCKPNAASWSSNAWQAMVIGSYRMYIQPNAGPINWSPTRQAASHILTLRIESGQRIVVPHNRRILQNSLRKSFDERDGLAILGGSIFFAIFTPDASKCVQKGPVHTQGWCTTAGWPLRASSQNRRLGRPCSRVHSPPDGAPGASTHVRQSPCALAHRDWQKNQSIF